jgi:hypothetical protein
LDWLLQLAPSAATLGAAAFGVARGGGKLRRNLRSDADLAAVLPDDFAGKRILMDHIEDEIRHLHERAKDGRRNWFGFTLGAAFALISGYATLWFFMHPEWWRWFGLGTGFIAVLGLVGIADSLELKKRDAKRRRAADRPEEIDAMDQLHSADMKGACEPTRQGLPVG